MTFAGCLKVLNGKIGLGHIFVSKSEKGRRAPRLVVAFVSGQQRPIEKEARVRASTTRVRCLCFLVGS